MVMLLKFVDVQRGDSLHMIIDACSFFAYAWNVCNIRSAVQNDSSGKLNTF